jgi:hypothetical protein
MELKIFKQAEKLNAEIEHLKGNLAMLKHDSYVNIHGSNWFKLDDKDIVFIKKRLETEVKTKEEEFKKL